MTKPNSSEIIVVLDRSGSMRAVRDDMVGGFETFIETQKRVAGDCRVSLFQFDDEFEPVYMAKPLQEVPSLVLIPRGRTALWDATAKAMILTGERLAKTPEELRPEKLIFVVITDGCENDSKEYGVEALRAMIKEQEEKYAWMFVYLGSSPTTKADAHLIGIKSASSYVSSNVGVRNMNQVLGQAVASYRSNNSSGAVLSVPQSISEHPDLPVAVSTSTSSQR